MTDGNWVRRNDTSKRWESSVNGGATFADLVERPLTEDITFNGITAPSGIAGKGVLYYDATANKFYVKENNGSAVEIANVAATPYSPPVTTKGDLFGYGAAADRLPIGTNYQHLVPDSGQTLGIKYFTPPFCRVKTSGGTSIANNTWAVLTWDTEESDNATMHDNVTNNSRITVPVAGTYGLTGSVYFPPLANVKGVALYKNGSLMEYLYYINAVGEIAVSWASTLALAASDYIEVYVFQNSGGTATINSVNFGKFSAVWLGD